MAATDATDDFLASLSESVSESFTTTRTILSFRDFLDRVGDHPERFARTAAQWLRDAILSFGTETVTLGGREVTRYKAFDGVFQDGEGRVVGNESAQRDLMRRLDTFVRERRVHRLMVLHGPNGSAKSSFVAAVMRAAEAYSRTDEGALYRFSWVFPSAKTDGGGRIGFGAEARARASGESWAYLPEDLVDARIAAEANDNPLFLLPQDARMQFLGERLGDDFVLGDVIRYGDLGARSRAIFDALLAAAEGDLDTVYRHVQVERFFVSRRYRQGAVTVEPQLRVDAGARQLTVDRSLASLPAALQSRTLFETFGPLVEGNRGIIEYNDFLKRPVEANKYLLSTSEKGTVSLDTGEMQLDAVLIATANETWIEAFKQQPDWPSWKARIDLVRMPYLLDWRAEQRIYDDLLSRTEVDCAVAPHTTWAVALWAVLSRLRRPDAKRYAKPIRGIVEKLTPVGKALLYADGDLPEGLKPEEHQLLQQTIPKMMRKRQARPDYEGRFGASAREMKALLLDAAHGATTHVSVANVLGEIEQLLGDVSVYPWLQLEPEGPFRRYDMFAAEVRRLWIERIERDVRRATGLVDETEYARLFERYVLHVKHWLGGEKIAEPNTGREVPPDEGLMDAVELTLGRSGEPRGFRSNIISRVAAFRIDHPDEAMDLTSIFPGFLERMRQSWYASRREQLARVHRDMLVVLDTPGEVPPEVRTRTEVMLTTLEHEFGYTREAAREAIGLLASG